MGKKINSIYIYKTDIQLCKFDESISIQRRGRGQVEGNRGELCKIEFRRNKQSVRGSRRNLFPAGNDCMLMNELDPRDTRRISGSL